MADTADSPSERAREVAFFLLQRFNMLTLAAALEPLRAANYLASAPLYRWRHLSPTGGPVSASNGIAVETMPFTDLDRPPGLLVLVASWGADHFHDAEVFAWLRRLERQGVELMALEMAVHILARAGLLAGRKATTHWSWMPGFAEKYPRIEAVEQLYAVDGKVMTCAGGSAALDLMLDAITREHGARLAAEVADQVLCPPARPGDAPQRRTLGTAAEEAHPDVRAAVALMEAHIAEPLTMPEIARDLSLSQRRLERLFHRHMGGIAGALQPASAAAACPGAAKQHGPVDPRRLGRLRLQLDDLFLRRLPCLLRQAAERLPPGLAGRRGGPVVAGILR